MLDFFMRLREFWANRPPLLRFLIALVVIAGLMLVLGRPALGIYRSWRAEGRAEAAVEALQGKRHAEARELALEALQGGGDQQKALPVLMSSADALNDPRSVDVGFTILGSEGFDDAVRLEAWNILCRRSQAWRLLSAWSQLPEDEKLAEDRVVPLVDRLLLDGAVNESALVLKDMPEPYSEAIEAQLLKLLLIKASSEAYGHFVLKIARLLDERPSGRVLWEPLIDELPSSSISAREAGLLVHALQGGGEDSGVAHQLRLARLQVIAEPVTAKRRIDEVVKTYGRSDPLALAQWCLSLGQTKEATRFVEVQQVSASLEDLVAKIQVIDAVGPDQISLEFLDHAAEVANQPAFSELFRAKALRWKGDRDGQEDAEEQALRAALGSANAEALIDLARLADQIGMAEVALEAWCEAIKRQIGPLPLATSLKSVVKTLAEQKREEDLLAVLASFRALEPGNPVIMAQHDYLACLKGYLEPETLIRNVTGIHERVSDALPITCALAFGYLLVDDPERAAELTDLPEVDWFAANPVYRAVRGLALDATGGSAEAEVLFEDFPWDELLDSEKRVLEGLREREER